MILSSGYKGHKGTCLFQRCWSLCKILPRITSYRPSNSVLVLRILTVVFHFNQFNSVYQIRSKVTCKGLIVSSYLFFSCFCPSLSPFVNDGHLSPARSKTQGAILSSKKKNALLDIRNVPVFSPSQYWVMYVSHRKWPHGSHMKVTWQSYGSHMAITW